MQGFGLGFKVWRDLRTTQHQISETHVPGHLTTFVLPEYATLISRNRRLQTAHGDVELSLEEIQQMLLQLRGFEETDQSMASLGFRVFDSEILPPERILCRRKISRSGRVSSFWGLGV